MGIHMDLFGRAPLSGEIRLESRRNNRDGRRPTVNKPFESPQVIEDAATAHHPGRLNALWPEVIDRIKEWDPAEPSNDPGCQADRQRRMFGKYHLHRATQDTAEQCCSNSEGAYRGTVSPPGNSGIR